MAGRPTRRLQCLPAGALPFFAYVKCFSSFQCFAARVYCFASICSSFRVCFFFLRAPLVTLFLLYKTYMRQNALDARRARELRLAHGLDLGGGQDTERKEEGRGGGMYNGALAAREGGSGRGERPGAHASTSWRWFLRALSWQRRPARRQRGRP